MISLIICIFKSFIYRKIFHLNLQLFVERTEAVLFFRFLFFDCFYSWKLLQRFSQRTAAEGKCMEPYCTSLQKHHPLSKGLLHTYIYIWQGLQELKQCHALSQGPLCILKATLWKECHTLLQGILCVYMYTDQSISISHTELRYFIMIFPHEWCFFFKGKVHNTIVQVDIS